jgi:predicted membrane metal-binding protein
MTWNVIFLIGGIATLVLGIFSLVQRRQTFLAVAGILWFCIVLFSQFIPNVYNAVIIKGLPVLGNLVLFLALPTFLVLAFFSRKD